jgi:hypothetical protein
VYPDGYANNWYQGLSIQYSGDKLLVFDLLLDTEDNFDFLQVETDSACASFGRVDYDIDPQGYSAAFRDLVWSTSGYDISTARTDTLELSGYGSGDTHCVYVVFLADGSYSPADGLQPTTLGAACVIDNVEILQDNGGGSYTSVLFEDFSGFTPGPGFEFVNMQESTPFGAWARVYLHVTDNDLCTENPGCAWLSTDDTTPTLANNPSMAFGPGSYVIKNWLDEIVIGPWVSLASTASTTRTIFQMRRFPGNFFTTSRITHNWAIRGRHPIANTDTPAPGDSIDCVSDWGHQHLHNALNRFEWVTSTWDATSDMDAAARDVQIRLRIVDRQWLAGSAPPNPFFPGPGPYWDRIRIGQQILTGPVIDEGIDARFQAQDAAPNDPAFEAGPMYAQAAGGDIFGTTAFSRSAEGGFGSTPNLIIGDSITVDVEDVLGHGGLTVELWGSIVAGPHAGKSPAPYSVQTNGFFVVPADSARDSNGNIVADRYFVDLDDTYFRGGDVLRYFWYAIDAQGGRASLPDGLTSIPASAEAAEIATGGLFEVDFLPTIDWDPGYLARIQTDPHGDLDPTQQELDNSSQGHCMLYVENVNARRRSGDGNRTSFMYTLDKLGYRGAYDIYDQMGLGNTNNQLGARMSPEQARDYALVVYDAGNRGPGAPILPDGVDQDTEKIDMQGWFQAWNALSGGSNAEHTLWILGSNAMQEKPFSPLYTADMGATFVSASQSEDPLPDVFGVVDFMHHTSCMQSHGSDHFALAGGCPDIRDYDDISASGTAVVTHRYGKGSPGTAGAMVMHAHAGGFTTILSSFAWFDVASSIGQGPETADENLLSKVLTCALPMDCQQTPDPTDSGDQDVVATPAHSALHQNTPNPFNPVTTVSFDLARDGHVSLRVYDVTGRLVRTLVDDPTTAGYNRQVTWNGLDDAGKRVPSGIYFYRMVAPDRRVSRKMILLK